MNIDNALEALDLPKLITKIDIKNQYYFLSKKYHPDLGGDEAKQEKINEAYRVLMKYIDEFRYVFDDKELSHQFPEVGHANRFRP